VRYGHYRRQLSPTVIPRFRCGHCRRTFSSQTFSTTYWLRRPDLLPAVFQRLLACSGYRQIAREAGCHPTTVMGLAARLGRHALLYLEHHRPPLPIAEPLVIDGFESFEFSQYHPLHVNLAVGAHSHYLYAFTESELRRKGRMTRYQRRRRGWLEARFGRPDPKAVERGVAALVEVAAPQAQPLTIHSDEHDAYPRAFRRLRAYPITHERTSSRVARTPGNPLFPVNLLDLLLRHNSANHKRETIAFSKRRQSVLERVAILAVWRNFMKPFSERHGGGTPAMRLGVTDRGVRIGEILRRRLFPERTPLAPEWAHYYRREVPTRRIPNTRYHQLTLAF